MRQSHFEGCQKQERRPMTRTEEGHVLQANDLASSDIDGADDRDYSTCGSESSERNSDDEGMFADEAQLTVEDYIRGLSHEYNPKRVLKYMSWQRRELTTIEREVVRFLRTISFGGGLSVAHTKEMLKYARGLGGMQASITTRCTRMMYVHCYVHQLQPFLMNNFYEHAKCTYLMNMKNVHEKCTFTIYISIVRMFLTFLCPFQMYILQCSEIVVNTFYCYLSAYAMYYVYWNRSRSTSS